MNGMFVKATSLDGMFVVEASRFEDERGSFSRIFCEEALAAIRPGLAFKQVNLSRTRSPGTVRGLHFQVPPAEECKYIRCMRGLVFDVAVDLRAGSPTFLRWYGVELAGNGTQQVFIPEGFAHGFQSLTEDVEMLYFHTEAWSREHERTVCYDEPLIGISWPLPATCVSQKDRQAPRLHRTFEGIQI